MLHASLPLVLAPMAGGPSTPQLCAAVSNTGAVGSLAAGYLSLRDLHIQAAETARLAHGTWGINLFVPGERTECADQQAWNSYREELANDPGVDAALLPSTPVLSDDHYGEKLEMCAGSDADFVSFTFGLPTPGEVEMLRHRGKKIIVGATTTAGVRAADALTPDAIVVQGIEAGGHRAAIAEVDVAENEAPTRTLVHEASTLTRTPLIAAGGVGSRADVTALLDAGAAAVQVGTLFLTAIESGTKPTHRDALLALRDRETVITTSFTGKRARAIRNVFIDRHTNAPSLYPEVHYLTAPIRAQANKNGNPEYLNLWAGTSFTAVERQKARAIVDKLMPMG